MASNFVGNSSNAKVRFLWYWLPVLIMIGLMYYASTDVLSADNTRGLIEQVVRWFAPHANGRTILRVNFWVRKTAHFTEYAALGWLLFRAFRADSVIRWRFVWVAYSLAVCVSWALLDELHQTVTRTRGGSLNDSLLDSTGTLSMLAAISLYQLFRTARRGRMR